MRCLSSHSSSPAVKNQSDSWSQVRPKAFQEFNIKVPWLCSDLELETAGSESVVSYETAEQSLVSGSEVAGRHNSLSVSGDNPECLALAVNNTNKPPMRLTTSSHNLA